MVIPNDFVPTQIVIVYKTVLSNRLQQHKLLVQFDNGCKTWLWEAYVLQKIEMGDWTLANPNPADRR